MVRQLTVQAHRRACGAFNDHSGGKLKRSPVTRRALTPHLMGAASILALVLFTGNTALADGGDGGQGGSGGTPGAGGTLDNPQGGDGTGDSGGGGGGPGGGRGGAGSGDGGDGGDGGAHGFSGAMLPTGNLTGEDGEDGSSAFPGSRGGGGGGGAGGYGALVTGGGTATVAGDQTISGGDGGDGGYGIAGYGNRSGGGGGGMGLSFSGDALTNAGTISGGTGGDSNRTVSGDGGIGVSFSGNALTNTGTITGGTGGGGGLGGSIGGHGGMGLSFSGDALTNAGTIRGGAGGDGLYNLSMGGSGGSGISMGDGTLTNTNTIVGGTGGSGGSVTGGATPGDGGTGSAGVNGTGTEIVNSGSIRGGDGGARGTGGDGNSVDGVGGTGIVGSNLTIINSGTIAGGLGGDNTTRANAITFTGGNNRLELHDGFEFTGNVEANGASDTFALGGDANPADPFDVSTLVDTGTAGATDEFIGFDTFEKTGDSVWTLTGATSAMTPWTISQGTLSVSSDASLGHANGALTFDGGVLQITGTGMSDIGREIVWGEQGGGFDIDDAAHNFTLSQDITGTGNLTKLGEGTLTLTGNNTYAGGTTISQGALVQGTAGAFAGNTAYIVNGGTLDLNNFDLTISSLSGSGGTVDLGDAELLIDQSSTTSYAGNITGAGDLAFTGGGQIEMTGDSASFSGATTVSGGTMLVGNAVGDGALGGTVRVENGGTLGGSGVVGASGTTTTIAAGGILAPGNSIGTLRVAGDLTFLAGSFFDVEVDDANGQADAVDVGGTATLAGTVRVNAYDSNFEIGNDYTILTAASRDGRFEDEVEHNYAYLIPTLAYDGNDVHLVLSRRAVDFRDLAETPNQMATADGVESLGAGEVFDFVEHLPDDIVGQTFDTLSGEGFASAQGQFASSGIATGATLLNRVDQAFAALDSAQPLGYAPSGFDHDGAQGSAWVSPFGGFAHLDGDGNAAALDTASGGLLLGSDVMYGDWLMGGFAGVGRTNLSIADRDTTISSTDLSIGAYGGWNGEGFGLAFGGAYTRHLAASTREVAVGALDQTLTADYSADTLSGFAEINTTFDMGASALTPYARLGVAHTMTEGFTETGGNAALSVEPDDHTRAATELGIRAEHQIALDTTLATISGGIGWRHTFGEAPSSTNAFSGGDPFSVSGNLISSDALVLNAGLDLDLSPTATFGVSYQGQVATGAQDHGVRAGFNVRF